MNFGTLNKKYTTHILFSRGNIYQDKNGQRICTDMLETRNFIPANFFFFLNGTATISCGTRNTWEIFN